MNTLKKFSLGILISFFVTFSVSADKIKIDQKSLMAFIESKNNREINAKAPILGTEEI